MHELHKEFKNHFTGLTRNFGFCNISNGYKDPDTGKIKFTNSYYYIGHFSKFVRPGAKRVSVGTTSNQLTSTAFVNDDDSLVAIVLNENDHDLDYVLTVSSKSSTLQIPKRSIQTIIIEKL